MIKSPAILPIAPTWRDIPQQVKPRAMSREGKRRSALHGLQMLGGVLALFVTAAAAWEVYTALSSPPSHPASPATVAIPIGDNVEPITDGVLDKAWLRRTLALPATATLANIDLPALRLRVLAGGQVKAAELKRVFPATLEVHLAERVPVARMMAQTRGGPKEYLVAQDGVVYSGLGYDPAMIKTLPWLDGIHPTSGGPGLATVGGMDQVSIFLTDCRLFGGRQFVRDWRVLSLARLELDGLIEVRTDTVSKITFDVRGNLMGQIARLDYVLGSLAGVPAGAIGEINLAVDSDHVFVTPAPVALPAGTRKPVAGQAGKPASTDARPAEAAASAAPLHFHIYP